MTIFSKSLSPGVHWTPVVSTQFPKLFSEPMQLHMENFLLLISMSRNSILRDMAALRNQIVEKQRSDGFLINFFNKLFGESTQDEVTLREFSRIPEVLRQCIDAFCRTFNVSISPSFKLVAKSLLFQVDQANLSLHENMPEEACPPVSSITTQKFSFFDDSDSLDTSKLNPHQMSLNASNIQSTIDPALLPIQTNEWKPLVRLLHILSEKINKKVQAF